MSKIRGIFLPIVIAMTAMLAFLPSARAAPALSIVTPSLLNLTPGSVLTFTVTADIPATDPPRDPSNVGVRIADLAPHFSAVGPLTPDSSISFTVGVPTDDLIASCVGGFVTYTYYLTTVGEPVVGTAPCSVATSVINVEPILPGPPTAVCGRDNDIVTIPPQPEGVLVAPGSDVWFEATLTVQFIPAVGYALTGTTTITFTDEVVPCLATPIDPVQTEVCGPNNDEILIPEQPANVILASTTEWVDGVRSIAFVPADAYEFDFSGWYNFTDANTLCTVDPGPSPTPAPVPTEKPVVQQPAPPLPPVPTEKPVVQQPAPVPPPAPPVVAVDPPAVSASSSQPAVVTALPSTGTGGSESSVLVAFGLSLIALSSLGFAVQQSRKN